MSSNADQPDWARVTDVFNEALEMTPADRVTFLDSACGADDLLRREVASLLEAHEQAGDLLDGPAAAAGAPESDRRGQPGLRIGHYLVVDILGEGGMGVVYLAEDTRLGRTVALKALPPQFTSDESRRERLRREARAAASLNHPGIAAVYALEAIEDQLFIASEYVPGETLRAELSRGTMSPARALETGAALARALAAAHHRGVIHRDLKPDNVIRTPSGDLKILDFGIARSLEDSSARGRLTANDTLLGTPSYMAPEQIRGGDDDPRSDLFALGAMIYEAVAGENPFQGSDAASTVARVLEMEPPPLSAPESADPEDIGRLKALERVILVCLSKTPAGRYGTAEDLAEALDLAHDARIGNARADQIVDRHTPGAAAWWWQFHQGATTIGYLALLVLVWMARPDPGMSAALLAFVAALVASVAASLLRLHLWFAVRSYPAHARAQRLQARPWLRLADVVFAASLAVAGLLVLPTHQGLATALVASAVAVVVVFAVIEPATTRAAFDDG